MSWALLLIQFATEELEHGMGKVLAARSNWDHDENPDVMLR